MRRFLFILLVLISQSIQSQDQLTNGEIFDFEVGDVFHREWSSSADSDERVLEVIGKEYSLNNDTVFYTYDRLRLYNYPDASPPWGIFTHDTLTEYHTDLYEFRAHYDSSTADPDYFTNRTINHHYNGKVTGEGGTSIHSRYGEGLGMVYYHYAQTLSGFPSTWAEEHLVYYKKGEEEYGEPLVLNTQEELFSDLIMVYPNPCADRIYWSYTVSNQREVQKVLIFDIAGNLIKSQQIEQNQQTLDVSELAPAIYMIKLQFESEVVHTRVIVSR